MNTEKLAQSTTLLGKPVAEGYETAPAPQPIDPATGMHGDYWVLSEAERSKGFVRPVRRSYRHETCGHTTTMGPVLCETYARDPGYYSRTFCCACRAHFPVEEFRWTEDGAVVGS